MKNNGFQKKVESKYKPLSFFSSSVFDQNDSYKKSIKRQIRKMTEQEIMQFNTKHIEEI